ncbi:MAG TPA: hypothetical protein VFF73_31555 [Planctomycetota bacterium]|nr:hypothetical protein [Planctomycetota bacterium]
MAKRAVIVALVLALVQGLTPLLLCVLQVGRPAFLCVSGFCADPLEGFGYCGNYTVMFWPLRHASLYAVLLAAEAGATVLLVHHVRHVFGRTRRGLLAAASVPLLLGALIVPNFYYASCLLWTGSYVDALTMLRDFFPGNTVLHGSEILLPLVGIVPLSLAYATFLEVVVIAEWKGLRPRLAVAPCPLLILAGALTQGRYVALASALSSAGWALALLAPTNATERLARGPQHDDIRVPSN